MSALSRGKRAGRSARRTAGASDCCVRSSTGKPTRQEVRRLALPGVTPQGADAAGTFRALARTDALAQRNHRLAVQRPLEIVTPAHTRWTGDEEAGTHPSGGADHRGVFENVAV